MNVYEKIDRTMEDQIDPTFDSLEKFSKHHPKLGWMVVGTLIAFFPVWTAIGQFVNKRR